MAEPVLSVEQIHKFLQTILHLPKEIIEKRSVHFLNSMILSWAERLPYNNVRQVLLTKHFARLATKQEIIDEQLAGRGGVCIYHAYFVYRVLGTLGYKVRLVPSTVLASYDHAIVSVHDVDIEGDEYLVELGGGFPALEAVPVHQLRKSETSTIEYMQAGLEFKYVLRGDVLSRYHRFGNDSTMITQHYDYIKPHNEKDAEGGWHRFYDCELRDFGIGEAFASSTEISRCLTIQDDRYFFLKHVRAVHTVQGKRLVAIKDNELLTQDNESGRQQIAFPNEQARLDAFKIHFPMLNVDQIAEAIEYVSQLVGNN